VIRSQEDLRRIFERKMQERQEFLDRYFVFSGEDWEPPKDYSRTNGLVEDVRQANYDIAEQLRLEEESKPGELLEHAVTDPIELPGASRVSGGPRTAPAPAPAVNAPATPAAPPAPARRPPTPRTNPAPRPIPPQGLNTVPTDERVAHGNEVTE
jgi:general secretion pathway protein D